MSYLMCGHHREARRRNPEKSKGNFDALELLIRLVRKTHGAKMKQQAVEPIEIARRIRYFGRMFKLGRQEDAHEFLIRVLESAQKSCLRIHHNMHPTSSGIVSETSAMYVVAVSHLSHSLTQNHTQTHQVRSLRRIHSKSFELSKMWIHVQDVRFVHGFES